MSHPVCGKMCRFMEATSGHKSWESVVAPVGSTHTCRVVKSELWGPHYGVRITLNIDFESVVSKQLMGKISKRRNHKQASTSRRTRFGPNGGSQPSNLGRSKTQVCLQRQKAALSRRAGRRQDGTFPIRQRTWCPARGPRRVGSRFGDRKRHNGSG